MKLRILVSIALSFVLGGQAFAQSSSSGPSAPHKAHLEGLKDAWTNRSLTPDKGQFLILAGPSSVQGLSVRAGWSAIQGPSEFGFNIRRHHNAWKTEILGIETKATQKSVQGAMPLGFVYAPIENLEVGLALPLLFGLADHNPAYGFRRDPNAGFGDMPIWATYQLTDDRVQLGLRAAFYLPTQTDFQMQFGLPILARLGGLRLESGVFVHITFDQEYTFSEVFVPARIGFQITPEIFAGARTGLNMGFVDGETFFAMPLYGFAGYTMSTDIGPIDFGLQFGFDQLFRSNPATQNREPSTSVSYPGDGSVDFSDFSLSFGANIALQF